MKGPWAYSEELFTRGRTGRRGIRPAQMDLIRWLGEWPAKAGITARIIERFNSVEVAWLNLDDAEIRERANQPEAQNLPIGLRVRLRHDGQPTKRVFIERHTHGRFLRTRSAIMEQDDGPGDLMTSSTFQKRATEEGRAAQDIAKKVLLGAGFKVISENQRRADVGALLNFVAEDQKTQRWYFDVSGAFTAARAGLIRTDTMWKALGRANVLSGVGIRSLILLTTNLPTQGSTGDKALHAARHTFLDAIEMLTAEGKARLSAYASGTQTRPLPGFLSPEEIFGPKIAKKPALGARLQVPVSETGDPLGRLHTDYEIKGMGHRLKVFVPSKTASGKAIDVALRRRVTARIKKRLSEVGGGCTTHEAEGSWVDPLAGVVDEKVLVLETYASRPFDEHAIGPIVKLILDELDQHTAAILVNEEMLQFGR